MNLITLCNLMAALLTPAMVELNRHYPCKKIDGYTILLRIMKTLIVLAAIISLSFSTPVSHAQSAKPAKHHHRSRTTTMTTTTDTTIMESTTSSPVGAEVSGITGSAPGDPYNLNHPYFQGD